VGIGKSIARTIFSGLGGAADDVGDITKTRLSKEQDLNNALARLQMGQSLEENSPLYKAKIKSRKDAASERARIVAERERRKEIGGLITSGRMEKATDERAGALSEDRGTRQALADLVGRTNELSTDDILKSKYGGVKERIASDLIPGYGLVDSLSRLVEGSQGEFGRMIGKDPVDTLGVPQAIQDKTNRLENLVGQTRSAANIASIPTEAEDLASYGILPEEIAKYAGGAETGIEDVGAAAYSPEVQAGLAMGDADTANKFIGNRIMELARQGYDVDKILEMEDDEMQIQFPNIYKAYQILKGQ